MTTTQVAPVRGVPEPRLFERFDSAASLFTAPPAIADVRDAFLCSAGFRPVGEVSDVQERRFRGAPVEEIIRVALGPGVIQNSRDLVRAISGGAISDALTTTLQSAVIQRFTRTRDNSAGLCREVGVPNYKTAAAFTLGETGLELRPRGAPPEMASLEAEETDYHVAEFSKLIEVDDQDWTDDNLNLIIASTARLGDAARRLRPDLFFATLLANPTLSDSDTLFSGTRGNSGTPALAAAGLNTAMTYIGGAVAEIDPDRRAHLNYRPAILVVPPQLAYTAHQLNEAAGNILQVRVESRIGTVPVTDPASGTAYTGSATRWYLFAGEGEAPIAVCAYLGGRQTPLVSRYALRSGRWGIGWKVSMSIGMKAIAGDGAFFSDGSV